MTRINPTIITTPCSKLLHIFYSFWPLHIPHPFSTFVPLHPWHLALSSLNLPSLFPSHHSNHWPLLLPISFFILLSCHFLLTSLQASQTWCQIWTPCTALSRTLTLSDFQYIFSSVPGKRTASPAQLRASPSPTSEACWGLTAWPWTGVLQTSGPTVTGVSGSTTLATGTSIPSRRSFTMICWMWPPKRKWLRGTKLAFA